MKITVQITPNPRPNSSAVFQLLQPLDPVVVARLNPEDRNFSHGTYYHVRGLFGDISNFLPMSAEDERYLLSIQPVGLTDNHTVNAIRNKLIGEGRPYFYRNGGLVFGNTVPFGNKIRIKTNPDGSPRITKFRTRFPAENDSQIRDVEFVEVDGFRKSDMGRPVAELIAEGRMGYWYEISATGKVSQSLAGLSKLLCPFYTDRDFPSNQGNYYLPKDYLVK